MRIAYHAPCSLQHGQKLAELPLSLLAQAGYHILQIPEGHLCCGSRPAPTICSSPSCPANSRAQARQHRQGRSRADRHRQYRLHDAAATRHLGPVRPHHRDARLGDRRPGARGDRPAQGLRAIRSRPWSSSPSRPPGSISRSSAASCIPPLGGGMGASLAAEFWLPIIAQASPLPPRSPLVGEHARHLWRAEGGEPLSESLRPPPYPSPTRGEGRTSC